MEQIERTAQKRMSGSSFLWWDQDLRSYEPNASLKSFLKTVIRYELSIYLDWRFQRECIKLEAHQFADLLDSILKPKDKAMANVDVLKVFLDHGADPNFHDKARGYSPWQKFLTSLYKSPDLPLTKLALGRVRLELYQQWLDQQRTKALELLLLRGADPNFVYRGLRGQESFTIEQIIEKAISSDNAPYLIDLLQRQRTKQKPNPSWFSWI